MSSPLVPVITFAIATLAQSPTNSPTIVRMVVTLILVSPFT
jgi:hypothetical protein